MKYGADINNKNGKEIVFSTTEHGTKQFQHHLWRLKTNKWVRGQTKVMEIMEIIKNRKWTWAGHIGRRTDNRWSAALTVWTPMGGEINRGRQRKKVDIWTTTVLGQCELVHEGKKPRPSEATCYCFRPAVDWSWLKMMTMMKYRNVKRSIFYVSQNQ